MTRAVTTRMHCPVYSLVVVIQAAAKEDAGHMPESSEARGLGLPVHEEGPGVWQAGAGGAGRERFRMQHDGHEPSRFSHIFKD